MPAFIGSRNRRSNPTALALSARFALPINPAASLHDNGRSAARYPAPTPDDVIPAELRARFRWRTAGKPVTEAYLSLDQMSTVHLFNALNWCFGALTRRGHVAYRFDLEARGEAFRLSWHMLLFCLEIERRGDLPALYEVAYDLIRGHVSKGPLPVLPEIPEHMIGGEE